MMIDLNITATICAGILMASFFKSVLSLVLNKIPLFSNPNTSSGSRSKDLDSVFSKSSGRPFPIDAQQMGRTHSFAIGKTKDGMSFQ